MPPDRRPNSPPHHNSQLDFVRMRVQSYETELAQKGALKPRDQYRYNHDRALLRAASRRKLLIRGVEVAAGGVLAAAAVAYGIHLLATDDDARFEDGVFSPGFEGWENLQNKEFNDNRLLAISKTLIADTDFPGFSEVGRLINDMLLNPNSLPEPKYTGLNTRKVRTRLGDVARLAVALTKTEVIGDSIQIDLINKQTKAVARKTFFAPTSGVESTVILDNHVSFAPTAAKKLILVKEFSHYLYLSQFKAAVAADVSARWEFSNLSTEQLPDFLLMNAIGRDESRSDMSLGGLYDEVNHHIDGAGYWHIMRVYGRMKDRKMLNRHDIRTLESADTAFRKALARGILKETNDGFYQWKEGIGPFSPEWTSIIVPILK